VAVAEETQPSFKKGVDETPLAMLPTTTIVVVELLILTANNDEDDDRDDC
jgi:hypothetical protein